MQSLLVSIRISGVEPGRLNGVLEPRLSALLQHLDALPGVEAECFISSERSGVKVRRSAFSGKPGIVVNPIPLSTALDGRIYAHLAHYGFMALDQVAWMSRREISLICGVGKKSLDLIEEALQKHGMGWLPDGMPLKQRDWKFLPVGALELIGFLPEITFPRGLDCKIELGRYIGFSDAQIAEVLNNRMDRDTIFTHVGIVKQHRAFIERVRSLVD